MINKSFVEMSMENRENFDKPLAEGMGFYSNTISGALAPINVLDVPLIIASLDMLSQELKASYPASVGFAKSLQEKISHETIIIKI